VKHICDGHEYTTTASRGHMDCKNNYGSLVATGTLSPCSEYWHFETLTGVDCGSSDSYHVNEIDSDYSVKTDCLGKECHGFTAEEQLVRWFAGVSS
jgi:hypothetical protein